MRIFYTLIYSTTFAFLLQAQSGWENQNSSGSFYAEVTKSEAHNALETTGAPVFISGTRDQDFCIYKYDCGSGFIDLKAKAIKGCKPEGKIKYTYKIDLNDDGSADFKGDTNDASAVYPFGKHKITWWAKDDCGNVTENEYYFKVKDCKPPVTNCINGMMVDLDADRGEVTILAADFDQGSYDNCEVIEFRVVTPSKGEGQTVPPTAMDSKSVTFDCDSKGVNTVDFWVRDNSDNWSYSTTFVIVQDKHGRCDENAEEDKTLGQKIGHLLEEVPLEIEKIVVPEDQIQQAENAGFQILSSQPNPFDEATTIGFELEKNTAMTFTIQDISGKVVKIIEKEFFTGYNQITLRKEDFENAGIYFFALQTNTHKATGKIILIQR